MKLQLLSISDVMISTEKSFQCSVSEFTPKSVTRVMKHTISPHAEELLTSKALKSAWFLLENTQITYKLGNIPGWQVAVLIKKNAENQTIP